MNRFARLGLTMFVSCVAALSALGQDASVAISSAWGYNTAYLKPVHQWESGIAQPFRYGWSSKVELRSNALELPIFPNVGVKIAQGERGGYVFASEHLISYPTLFLNTVAMKGTGGLISPEFAPFPTLVSLRNTLIVSKPAGTHGLLNAFLGYTFSIRSSKPDPNATIDLPLVYPRLAHNYDGSTIRVGFMYKAVISKKFLYEDGVETFIILRNYNNFFFENTGALMWIVGKSFRIRGGYSLSYGRYPYGTQWQLWPAIDFVFGSKL